MATLARYYSSSKLIGFFSYSRQDDTGFKDVLSAFRTKIQEELGAQLGLSTDNFNIWQDTESIPHGALWQEKISAAIKDAVFFIPIITPRVINSPHCATEFNLFLARETELGRDNLIFPILYIDVPELKDGSYKDSPVLKIVHDRQYFDWRPFRYRPLDSPEAAQKIGEFCEDILKALREPWVSPEERRQQQEAEAEKKRVDEQKRTTAEIAIQKVLEETKQREVAEAARLADEAKRREQERVEAEQREAEARQREEALARQHAEEERALAMAKAAGTVNAFDVFLDAHPESTFAGDAKKLRENLLARQQAHDVAMASDDPAVLRSFCKTYKIGADVAEVRERLRVLVPPTDWKSLRPAMAIAATIAVVVLGAALFWFFRPTPSGPAVVTAPVQPSPVRTVDAATPPVRPVTPTQPPSKPAVVPSVQPQSPAASPVTRGSADAGPSAVTPPPLAAVSPVVIPPVVAPPVFATTPQPTAPLKDLSKDLTLQPTAPSQDLSKWAFCRPSGPPQNQAMGGDNPNLTPIKVTITEAQQKIMAVRAVVVSPDEKTIVSAGDDGIIRVWQTATLKWLRAIHGHSARVNALAFSSDGNLMASASFDGTVQIWDAHTFAHLQTLDSARTGSGQIVPQGGVAFEPVSNPQYVYSGGADGNVWIWDWRKQPSVTKTQSGTGKATAVGWISFAPNGSKAYATANFDGTIRFFDPNTTPPVVAYNPGNVLRLAYSPDGSMVASAGADKSGKLQGLKIWNGATHTLFKSLLDHKGHAASVAWADDNQLLASGGGYTDATVALWDIHSVSQTPMRIYTPNNKSVENKDVEAVTFHPNKKWLISGSEDGTMRIWNAASGSEILTIMGIPGSNDYVAYAPSGCYTGSANVADYVNFVWQGHEQSAPDLFVPNGLTQALLPQ
jgi:WD40 repeat protein